MKRSKTYGGYLLLIGLMLLAFWLRLHNITAFSFWTDEGLTPLRSSYTIAQILRNEIVIQGVITKDTHPPFYYLTIHVLRPLFGETDLAYRYPALLASLLLIPLLYQLGRRLGGRGVGWAAAGLTAVNPLHIWYANEARMYSLYVLLMAGAAYALWRALSGGDLRRWLSLYILLAGLGLYTHYTAVFLIAFQAPFWVWLLWRQGQQKLIIGAGLVGLLAAIPLIPVTIPRLFTGTEAHYSYVSPIIMFQDVVRFFSLGMTVDFNQVGIQLLTLIILGLLLLGLYAARSWKPRVFLISYLLAVVFGLMAGSLLKPMYQGVRHIMVGSPAFLLLLAWGLCFAWEQGRKTAVRPLWTAFFAVGALAVFVGPAVALHNLYNRHDLYAKDDFRALIRSIERQAGGNDVVVHNNAILLPLHAHYQQRADLPVTAVPRYPTHAAAAEPDLLALAETYDRIWLVTDPPADDRDNDRLVQRWMASELSQIATLGAHSQRGIVEALAFSAAPLAASGLPAEAQPLDTQWPELSALRGILLADEQPVTRPALWFALFWEVGQGPPPPTMLRFSLQDQDGREWFAANHPLQPDASKAWPETGLVRFEYALVPPPGLPPGDYHLLAQPLDRAGAAASLATIRFAATGTANMGPFDLGRQIRFANGLRLVGWEAADLGVRPSHTLPLTLYWQTGAPLALEGLRYELTVLEPDGETLREQSDRPGAAWLPEIAPGTVVREQTGLFIRPDVAPGRYRLRWRLLDEGEAVPGRPFWRPWSGETITLGEIEVIPWPIETALPDGLNQTDASFGLAIDLYGYTLETVEGEAAQLALSLTWQVQAKPDDSYLLFVHLVSAADGTILSQADRVPGDGRRPTSGWRAGEVIQDRVVLPIPADALPGDYQLLVGFYQPEREVRLPVAVGDTPQPDGQLLLTTVTLP